MHPHKVLLFILLSAFLLRVWGIWNADSTDEYNEVFEALRVCSGSLNFERWGKRFYLYILSLEYSFLYLIGYCLNIFQSPIDFATKVIRDLTPLLLLGRITSAVFGTASVFLTYLIGKSLFNDKAGIIASLFLCFNVVNIELSHYARVDATLCLIVLIAFYSIVKILKGFPNASSKYYLLAGLFSGIAFQTKQPAIILIISFLFAHLFQQRGVNILNRLLCKDLGLYCLSFILGLIVGNPAIIFAPHKFISFQLGMGMVFTTPIQESKSEHIGFIAYIIYFHKELGLMLGLTCLYSFIRGLLSKQKEDILLLSFIIPFFVLMGSSRYIVSDSYMIPLMPLLYILTAQYLTKLITFSRHFSPT